MYDMKQWCSGHGIQVSEEQEISAQFLQSRGQRFMVEFGYDNCVAKADELFFEECLLLAVEPETSIV